MTLYYCFQTYFVYLSILAVMYFSCRKAVADRQFHILVIGLLFYSLIFGLRYGVGTDCNAYIMAYNDVQKGWENPRIEAGFNMLMKCFAWIGAPEWIFMGFVAFLQVYAVFRFFKKRLEITPYLACTFVLGCIWLTYGNGMRQSLSFSLFVFSLSFLENKQWLRHYLLILLAIMFHNSAMLLIFAFPMYIILSKKTLSIKIQYILFVCAFVLGKMSFINDVMHYIENGATLIGYDSYLDDRYAEKLVKASAGVNGIGYYVALLINLLIIKYSYLFDKKSVVIYIYNLLFAGVLIRYAFYDSPLVQRVNYYFYGFNYIIAAFILYDLRNRKMLKSYYAMLSLYVLTLIGTLYRMFDNDSAFFFIWQTLDYKMMH